MAPRAIECSQRLLVEALRPGGRPRDALAVRAGVLVVMAVAVVGCGRFNFNTIDPVADDAPPPPPVPLGIVAGDRFRCALRPDGRGWGWGDARFGQLGAGSLTPRATAEVVGDLAGVVQIDAGSEHACARFLD